MTEAITFQNDETISLGLVHRVASAVRDQHHNDSDILDGSV